MVTPGNGRQAGAIMIHQEWDEAFLEESRNMSPQPRQKYITE